MAAMPITQIINIMAAGIADPAWPNQPEAHLMVAYSKETYVDNTTLSQRDLENCTIEKDPKVLFERLTAVQFKYQGNAQANVTKDDLVAQAVQALPAVYNSTVAQSTEQKNNDQARSHVWK
jgi:hypothetical protein